MCIRCPFIVFHCLSLHLFFFTRLLISFVTVVAVVVVVDVAVLCVCFCVFVHCSQPMDDGIQGFMARVTAPGVTEVKLTSKYKLLVCRHEWRVVWCVCLRSA